MFLWDVHVCDTRGICLGPCQTTVSSVGRQEKDYWNLMIRSMAAGITSTNWTNSYKYRFEFKTEGNYGAPKGTSIIIIITTRSNNYHAGETCRANHALFPSGRPTGGNIVGQGLGQAYLNCRNFISLQEKQYFYRTDVVSKPTLSIKKSVKIPTNTRSEWWVWIQGNGGWGSGLLPSPALKPTLPAMPAAWQFVVQHIGTYTLLGSAGVYGVGLGKWSSQPWRLMVPDGTHEVCFFCYLRARRASTREWSGDEYTWVAGARVRVSGRQTSTHKWPGRGGGGGVYACFSGWRLCGCGRGTNPGRRLH